MHLYLSSMGCLSDVAVACSVMQAVPVLSYTIPSYTVELLKLPRLYRILLWGCAITFIIAFAIGFVFAVFH